MCPLPSRERAPLRFNRMDWVRGSLYPLTQPCLSIVKCCPLPQGEGTSITAAALGYAFAREVLWLSFPRAERGPKAAMPKLRHIAIAAEDPYATAEFYIELIWNLEEEP